MTAKSETRTIAGREITIETGKLAKQANGSVVVRCGNTVMLATAVMSKEPKSGIDFFPLTIEYVEKMYSAGKIPGGFFKREGRPTTDSTLTARLIDRPVRPCFPKYFFHEVQIAITVLSFDETFAPEFLAMIAASAALSVSDIPFNGPIGAAYVCDVDGELKANPTFEEEERSTLQIMVAGSKDAIMMIESGASEVSEDRILEAIQVAHAVIKETVAVQEDLQAAAGKTKIVLPEVESDEALSKEVSTFVGSQIEANMQSGNKEEIDALIKQLETDTLAKFVNEDESNRDLVKRYFGEVKKAGIRNSIISKKQRPDGRKLDEIRDISIEVSALPATHGSAVFTRGETQSLGVVTLGTDRDKQIIDGLKDSEKNPYMFHYNFPPYSVGEVGFMGRTSRRELGHGALAGRALQSVLPSHEDFPYTIRIVSEILESNGSSSMASVCSGSLALMDAGAPITAPVSGIAMGLLISGDDYVILSDIQGLEDHYGDMDFKVAGTEKGITALQLDIKVSGLSEDILRNALAQAKDGRLHILNEMSKVMQTPRAEVSSFAPKIEFVKINPEKVGMLIGPGGKQIKAIEEESGAVVFVVDGEKGEVSISGKNAEEVAIAKRMVLGIVKDVERGEVYEGRVIKIVAFGAFIELLPGKEGLLHISKVADHHIKDVSEYLKEGQNITVKVENVDPQGKISLVRAEAVAATN
ncbi:polyribonucleotide nucleotidyltransferase [bacterium]|jgi:polyribonucleotide nucleotidyltransferase|nr:polyribonucleotide nucleotidyltransferase [bacterium]